MNDYLIRKNGAVYTPEKLSRYVAQKILQYALQDKFFDACKNISVIDPATGDGILLESITKNILGTQKLMRKKVSIYGSDIDQKAIKECREKGYHY